MDGTSVRVQTWARRMASNRAFGVRPFKGDLAAAASAWTYAAASPASTTATFNAPRARQVIDLSDASSPRQCTIRECDATLALLDRTSSDRPCRRFDRGRG